MRNSKRHSANVRILNKPKHAQSKEEYTHTEEETIRKVIWKNLQLDPPKRAPMMN